MYREEDLVRIAKRENNRKRNYLVVNPLQGKHIPAAPDKVFALFRELAEICRKEYDREQVLVIGFAETATAIGAAVAIAMDKDYIQTTREDIPGVTYLYFSEEHSHASQQKLVRNDLDNAADNIERILFVEDEVTTGKTIWNIIDVLEAEYPGKFRFSVASLLNSMDDDARKRYQKRGISLHYLIRVNHRNYPDIAEAYAGNGSYVPCDITPCRAIEEARIVSGMDARRLVKGASYQSACDLLWKEIKGKLEREDYKNVLVLGTEEFMYPALFTAKKIEGMGMRVRFHATTRSPAAVSEEPEYPLRERYELRSLYEKDRVTFLYNLEKYDLVLILTDARENGTEGVCSLVNAIAAKGNRRIMLVRWCGE